MIEKAKWLSLTDFKKTEPQDDQYQWLAENGSMTDQLSRGGELSLTVRVINASETELDIEEQLFLKLHATEKAFVREVVMEVNKQPWMVGRTIIPISALNGEGEKFKNLGSTSLGKVLFKDKTDRRLFIEVAKIDQNHYLYPSNNVPEARPNLWARRSMFEYNQQKLMVQEVFLPACPLQLP